MEIRTIHCPVDFSPISRRNVRMGVEMCKRIGSRLVLHHNLEAGPPGFLSVSWMWSEDHGRSIEDQSAAAPDQLDELLALVPAGVEHEVRLTRGPLEESVLFVARGLPADLMIMGTHGRTTAEHDSLTERIVLQAPCPVMSIREEYDPVSVFDAPEKPKVEAMRFLVPVDLSTRSRRALMHALELARDMPHLVRILHVVRPGPDGAQNEREAAAAKERLESLIPADLEERVTVTLRQGEPVAEIVEAAREIDALAIVMGAHSKGMLRRLLFGTKTLEVLHAAPCPVWFVPDSAGLESSRPPGPSGPSSDSSRRSSG